MRAAPRINAAPIPPSATKFANVTKVIPTATIPKSCGVRSRANTKVPMNAKKPNPESAKHIDRRARYCALSNGPRAQELLLDRRLRSTSS